MAARSAIARENAAAARQRQPHLAKPKYVRHLNECENGQPQQDRANVEPIASHCQFGGLVRQSPIRSLPDRCAHRACVFSRLIQSAVIHSCLNAGRPDPSNGCFGRNGPPTLHTEPAQVNSISCRAAAPRGPCVGRRDIDAQSAKNDRRRLALRQPCGKSPHCARPGAHLLVQNGVSPHTVIRRMMRVSAG